MSPDREWADHRIELAREKVPDLPGELVAKVRELIDGSLQESELTAKARKDLADELLGILALTKVSDVA